MDGQVASTSKCYNTKNISLCLTNIKAKFTEELKRIYNQEKDYPELPYENQTCILIQEDTFYLSNDDVLPTAKRLKGDIDKSELAGPSGGELAGGSSMQNKTEIAVFNPLSKEVKRVSDQVVLKILYQPWADLNCICVSVCCQKGAFKCQNSHGKQAYYKEEEEPEEYIEEYFRSMDSVTASALLKAAVSKTFNPPSLNAQYILLNCMDSSEKCMETDMYYLNKLLETHPPCDNSMVNYYRKIIFGSVKCMKAPDGVFWWCIYKINDLVNVIEEMAIKLNCDLDSIMLNNSSEYAKTYHISYQNHMNKNLLKLKLLFYVLNFIINIMEADLTMGLLKNVTNLHNYVHGNQKPYIALAIWESTYDVGINNSKIRHLMKLYLKIFCIFQETDYSNHFRRLLSLIAGVINASEINFEPCVFPSIRDNCREFARDFMNKMLQESLTVADVFEILKSLRPVWFQFLVCKFLLELLDGRREYHSVNSLLALLKDLNETMQNFPSSDEMSATLLREDSDTYWESGEMPRKHFIKLTMLTSLAIVLKIKISGVSRINRNLSENDKVIADATFVQFRHPSFKEDYFEFKKLLLFVQQMERCKKGFVEILSFLGD